MRNFVLLVLGFLAVIGAMSAQAKAGLVEKTMSLSFPADKPNSPTVIFKGLAFDSGAIVDSPQLDAPSWDVRFKQGYPGTNGGAVAVLENTVFEAVTAANPGAEYKADKRHDPSGPAPTDVYNENLLAWGDYFFLEGHLFAPHPHVFVVKTKAGNYAKLQIIDYVKNGKAICAVREKDFLGRVRVKKRETTVGTTDNLVRLTVRYAYNTVSGDLALGQAPEQAPVQRQQPNASCPNY